MKRLEALDGLRGIAALSVVFHHCFIAFPLFFAATTQGVSLSLPWFVLLIAYSPLHFVWAGPEAVLLFFVLSGYVLTLPYAQGNPPHAGRFLAKRVCRIYLPYLAAMAISAVLLASFRRGPFLDLSVWFNLMWRTPMSLGPAIDAIFMLGATNQNFDTATWSLVHEMRVSLVFPFLVALGLRLGARRSLATFLAVSVLSRALPKMIPGLIAYQTLFNSAYYSAFFVLGIVLALRSDQLRRALFEDPGRRPGALATAGCLLYALPWYIPLNGVAAAVVADWSAALGASVFILFALHRVQVRHVLESRPLLWLGKVSYSLYLIHPVVLLLLIHALHGHLPTFLIAAAVPLVALFAAAGMWRLVEAPSIALGRRFGGPPRAIRVLDRRQA